MTKEERDEIIAEVILAIKDKNLPEDVDCSQLTMLSTKASDVMTKNKINEIINILNKNLMYNKV